MKWVGWAQRQCTGSCRWCGAGPRREEITIVSHKSGTIQATINCHISGSIYSVTSDDDSIDDAEYDLLLPTCVRWSSWRLSDCSEYNASESESESEGEDRNLQSENEEESEVSGSDSD